MFLKKFSSIAALAIAIVLATAPLAMARGPEPAAHGGGFAAHGPSAHFDGHGGFRGHHGFDGRHFDGRHFDHRFDRRLHGGAVVVAPFYWPYYYTPDPGYTYEAPAPSYWYYCPSYGSYYPTVQSCPEAWVPVPG